MKRVLITGASGGIGTILKKQFLERGCEVISLDITKSDDIHKNLKEVIVDLTDYKDVKAKIKKILLEGKIDILINNAGWGYMVPVELIDFETYRKTIELNVIAQINMLKEILPSMRERNEGKIINISSVAGIRPHSTTAPYSSTKFSIEAITTSLIKELEGTKIQVSTINPTSQDTDFQRKALEIAKEQGNAIEFYDKIFDDRIKYLEESSNYSNKGDEGFKNIVDHIIDNEVLQRWYFPTERARDFIIDQLENMLNDIKGYGTFEKEE